MFFDNGPVSQPVTNTPVVLAMDDKDIVFPPGLLGETANWVLASAQYQNRQIALVTAIALLSGMTGRAYNTYTGAGLNQYILLLANTGMGKEVIATAIGKLIAEITKTTKAAGTFKGPSHIASVQALIKWLVKHPAIISIFGEFGQKLKAMAKNPSPNDTALLAGFLEFYSKSGSGCVVDPLAYSDSEKNTPSIFSPSFSMLGETVPSELYNNIDEKIISNGLLPRFLTFEVNGKRPYANTSPVLTPPADLVGKLSDLAAICLGLGENNNVIIVNPNDEARHKFVAFEKWTTDKINQSESEVYKQLWNRCNLKALKLASLYAISDNQHLPVINIEATMWATNLVVAQTETLLGKFERNEVGTVDGDETKQRAAMLRIIRDYIETNDDLSKKYSVDPAMHKVGIITLSYISRRLATLPTFKNDRGGATAAIKRTVNRLLEDDELRELPKAQMIREFASKPRAFAIGNSQPFLEAIKI